MMKRDVDGLFQTKNDKKNHLSLLKKKRLAKKKVEIKVNEGF